MKTRCLLIATVLLLPGLTGCAARTCERLCDFIDGVSEEGDEEPWEGCVETCEDDYSQAGNYCRASLGRLGRCIEGFSAERAWDECLVDFQDVSDDCACTINACVDECAETYGERLPTETCTAIVDTEPDS